MLFQYQTYSKAGVILGSVYIASCFDAKYWTAENVEYASSSDEDFVADHSHLVLLGQQTIGG